MRFALQKEKWYQSDLIIENETIVKNFKMLTNLRQGSYLKLKSQDILETDQIVIRVDSGNLVVEPCQMHVNQLRAQRALKRMNALTV